MGRFWVEMFCSDAWTLGQWVTVQWIAIGSGTIEGMGLVARILAGSVDSVHEHL